MVDLHCHILPGIDDGAKTIHDSVDLMQREIHDGVDMIAMTPHYYGHKRTIDEFIRQREKSYQTLAEELKRENILIRIVLGAEVYFTPTFLKRPDKSSLCYRGTQYMLIEFPTEGYYDWIPNAIYQLGLEQIVPVIAHIERYPFIQSKPERLNELVDAGAIIQTNAESLTHILGRHKLLDSISEGLIHLIATDTHSINRRPPMLGKAMEIVKRKLGAQKAQELEANAYRILANKPGIGS